MIFIANCFCKLKVGLRGRGGLLIWNFWSVGGGGGRELVGQGYDLKSSQSQNSSKFPNLIGCNAEKQIVPRESAAQ